jgi:predicted alpha/beta-fold hydrolase
MEKISIENIDIPIESDELTLKGSIYFSPNTGSEAPWIINLAGLYDHRESYFVKLYTEKFAEAGYYVLSYDYRAHGETAKQTGKNWYKQIADIFSDLHSVVDWVFDSQKERMEDKKLFLFGRSLGGAIILTHGFIDERVKKLIALCTRYDYHNIKKISFTQDVIRKISPVYFLEKQSSNKDRILLAHCRDDPQIPFENLKSIQEHLHLPDSNVVIYNTGGHSFRNHREDLFQKSLEFLKT